MIQICEYPCNSLQEARTEERRYYELLNAELNMINPCKSKKEYIEENKKIISEKHKIYRDENKDTLLKYAKIYRDENKDTISEKKKIKYQENKNIILEKAKQKYTCCCGSKIRKGHKIRHEKTNKHNNYINR
jgi:hypothetical protein